MPYAKRSLGQNFLVNSDVVERIADLASLSRDDTVLEIGPGRGALTRVIAGLAGTVYALEKDDDLLAQLREDFGDQPHVHLVSGDALKVTVADIVPLNSVIVGNLPYNIATRIIMDLVAQAPRLSRCVFMVQKEVGERLLAEPGDHAYGSLTVMVRSAFIPRPGFIVGPGNFRPRPKVDSQVLRLDPRPEPVKTGRDFSSLVSIAFTQRRKMLRNNLKNLPGMDEQRLADVAERAGINLNHRAQQLSVEDFARLSLVLEESAED